MVFSHNTAILYNFKLAGYSWVILRRLNKKYYYDCVKIQRQLTRGKIEKLYVSTL